MERCIFQIAFFHHSNKYSFVSGMPMDDDDDDVVTPNKIKIK